jgi:hypothetical protein
MPSDQPPPRRMRGANHFRQRDIMRAVTALAKVGKSANAVRVEKDGTFVVLFSDPSQNAPAQQREQGEWDAL